MPCSFIVGALGCPNMVPWPVGTNSMGAQWSRPWASPLSARLWSTLLLGLKLKSPQLLPQGAKRCARQNWQWCFHARPDQHGRCRPTFGLRTGVAKKHNKCSPNIVGCIYNWGGAGHFRLTKEKSRSQAETSWPDATCSIEVSPMPVVVMRRVSRVDCE